MATILRDILAGIGAMILLYLLYQNVLRPIKGEHKEFKINNGPFTLKGKRYIEEGSEGAWHIIEGTLLSTENLYPDVSWIKFRVRAEAKTFRIGWKDGYELVDELDGHSPAIGFEY